MPDSPEQFAAYLAIHLDEKTGNPKLFKLSPNLEEAETAEVVHDKQANLFDPEDTPTTVEYEEEGDQLSPAATLCASLLDKFYNSLSAYHELTFLTSNLRSLYAGIAIHQDVLAKVRTNGHELRRTSTVETFGLTSHLADHVAQVTTRMRRTDVGLSLLPASVLLSLVATFDSLVGDAVKELLRMRPERITSSERTITYRELFFIDSLDDAKARFIDEDIDRLLRGNHDSQVEYIERLVDTKIRSHYSRYPNFLEVFERRNIVAHANGTITPSYASKCEALGVPCDPTQIGKPSSLKPKYLHKAIDTLTEFGVLMSFVAWRKLAAESEKVAFSRLNMVAFEAIRSRRFELATWLLDFALHRQTRGSDEVTTRMMYMNLANCYKKRKNEAKCQETLAELDWSASSDLFALGLASLNGDHTQAAVLLKSLSATNKLRPQDFREWPIFDWIRDNEEVVRAFEEGFGEPLAVQISSPAANEPDDKALAVKADENSASADGEAINEPNDTVH